LSVALARCGDTVVVVGRDRQRIEAVVAEAARASGEKRAASHLGLAFDVSNPEDMNRMAGECVARYGRIDMLIACAAIGRTRAAPRRLPFQTIDLPLSEWEGLLAVNLHGVFLSNQAVLPSMIARRSGDIVNLCSSTTSKGLRGRPFAQAYCAAKFAVAGFSQTLAREVEAFGVRVHAIFPGAVDTPLIDNTLLDLRYGGRMDADGFAETLIGLLDPRVGARLPDPHILPLPSRSSRRAGAAERQEMGGDGQRGE